MVSYARVWPYWPLIVGADASQGATNHIRVGHAIGQKHYSDRLLAGIRVIDLTSWFFAPFATTMLAEMGADVIKVEELPAGDPARGVLHIGPPSASGFQR